MNNSILMRELARRHDSMGALMEDRSVHYLDIPVHDNIGDLLIMMGTLTFFMRHHISIRSHASLLNTCYRSIQPGDTIVFNGGGNLGDLYPQIQAARERLISMQPNCRIVILPQTIYFSNNESYQRCKSVFRTHPDLHLFTRDRHSFDLGKQMCQNVYLMPDMAHELYPLKRICAPLYRELRIRRTDKESGLKGVVGTPTERSVDWADLAVRKKTIIRCCRLAMRLFTVFNSMTINTWACVRWEKYAERLVNNVVRSYSEHEVIDTDRLHGHILACLMDIPNTVRDNSYGKNSGYCKLWTLESDIVILKERCDEY